MAAKTLSTSTLSLKFMQNAHRAKNIAEVQLEKADVKDDGEWEVAKEIRDAWGPETAQSVSYEASYLPFLFAADAPDNATPTALKGRRAFKRGREVADEYQPIVPAAPTPPNASTSKSQGKPKAISSTLSGRPSPKKANINGPKGKTARQAIYDSSGVGADLRAQKSEPVPTGQNPNANPSPAAPNVFLKPAGVDEPADSAQARSKASNKTPTPESVERKQKGKREREATAESAEGDSNKKRKKKKKKDDQTAAASAELF
ncbi:hypothetical protein B0H11DRAFT_171765 [Mycena galericulata]|nr:hypothetical protein B0H11DRAFT_171765 [Mycena galericulata]